MVLHADGGARGNPGPAGIGVVLVEDSGTVLGELAQSIGTATNNVAEYSALIAGLELALEHHVTDLRVCMDSELVVAQLSGQWKIKNERLRQLAARAASLLTRFESATIVHVRRELNADADKLANQGMDRAALEEEADLAGPEQSSFLE